MNERHITPKWIETLQENEIFVFGCRNSGRHFDGASNFALNHFGAIMGQREGRQGQSYAIPTIGGHIGRSELKASIETFTQYAATHPELHFLVTPVGCGGGLWPVRTVAPMFRKASKLPNVSLPQEFWNELDNGRTVELKHNILTLFKLLLEKVYKFLGKLHLWCMKIMPPKSRYKILITRQSAKQKGERVSLEEDMEWIRFYDDKITKAATYLINHVDKTAYMLIDNHYHLCFIKDKDIDRDSIADLPQDVKNRVSIRERRYDFGIQCFENGLAQIVWQISPDGSYHYLDKYYCGKQTDEKYIALLGVIDTHCRFVEKLHVVSTTREIGVRAGVNDDRAREKLLAWKNY